MKNNEIRNSNSQTKNERELLKQEFPAQDNITVSEQYSKEAMIQTVKAVESVHYSPLPPPDVLQEYNIIVPNTANKLIDITIKSMESDLKNQEKLTDAYIKDGRLGLIFAFLIAVLAIIVGFGAIYLGYEAGGAWITTLGIGSIIGSFVYGTHNKKKIKNNFIKTLRDT